MANVAGSVRFGAVKRPGPGKRLLPGSSLKYYEAIEQASQHMLQAAHAGDWDHAVKHEGVCGC